MKALALLALATVGLLTMNNSCHQAATEAPCPEQELTSTVPTPRLYPCIPGQSKSGAQLFVINSAAEWMAAFPCSSYSGAGLDFANNTLLVGWQPTSSCGHVKSQRLLSTCTSYTYKVEIEVGVCTAATPVTSTLLVPKLPAGAKVLLDMQ